MLAHRGVGFDRQHAALGSHEPRHEERGPAGIGADVDRRSTRGQYGAHDFAHFGLVRTEKAEMPTKRQRQPGDKEAAVAEETYFGKSCAPFRRQQSAHHALISGWLAQPIAEPSQKFRAAPHRARPGKCGAFASAALTASRSTGSCFSQEKVCCAACSAASLALPSFSGDWSKSSSTVASARALPGS